MSIVRPRRMGTNARWLALLLTFVGCGEDGLLPGTVERGSDFNIAEVVYDENYFYCAVEPMLVSQQCGPGADGDNNGCHATRTSYRLTEYMPLVADSCNGLVPGVQAPAAARQNYTASQARMNRDPELAPLLIRPTGEAAHPRVIFDSNSPEADVIRQWATRYSTK